MKQTLILSKSICLFIFLLISVISPAQQITVFCTNDIHGHIMPETRDHIIDIGLVSAIKQKTINSLLFDAGDMAYGMPVAAAEYVNDLAELLNLAGYNCMTLGNHEFDYNLPILEQRIKASGFPYLSANIKKLPNKQNYLSTIAGKSGVHHGDTCTKVINGIKVGYFGLTTERATCRYTKDKLEINDAYVATSKEQVSKLKNAQAEIIIAITHLGKTSTQGIGTDQILEQVTDINLIVDGHSHDEYCDLSNDKMRGVIQAGTESHKMGKVVLEKDSNTRKWKVSSMQLLSYDDVKDIPIPETVRNKIKAIQEKIDKTYGDTQFSLDWPLWGGGVTCLTKDAQGKNIESNTEPLRLSPTLLGHLWSFAMRKMWIASTDPKTPPYSPQDYIVLRNGGSFRAGIPAGIVNGIDIYRAFPNDAEVIIAKICHKELHKLLSASTSYIKKEDNIRKSTGKYPGAFLQWQGVSGYLDLSNPQVPKRTFQFSYMDPFEYPSPVGAIINPNDSTSFTYLLTTTYVLDDKLSYGTIKYEKLFTLGNELQLLKNFFNTYKPTPEWPLFRELFYFKETNTLSINGEEYTPPYTPSIILKFEGKILINSDVRYTIYNIGNSEIDNSGDYINSTDSEGRLQLSELVEDATIIIECDTNLTLSNGKKVYITLHGQTYTDPILGCGNKYPVVINLMR